MSYENELNYVLIEYRERSRAVPEVLMVTNLEKTARRRFMEWILVVSPETTENEIESSWERRSFEYCGLDGTTVVLLCSEISSI